MNARRSDLLIGVGIGAAAEATAQPITSPRVRALQRQTAALAVVVARLQRVAEALRGIGR